MSLPPGFLDELRTRTSLSQVVGRKVMWDTRKSNQGKGDMWAPCPFHQEKSASFHVDDRKGFYYCFGCQAKGDAISFVCETENVDFMEAIKILAGEAGMSVPERDPQAQVKADRRTQLIEVMEMAVAFFRLQLKTGAGTAARAYLDKRGMSEQTREKFGIGFAPDGWHALWEHLRGKGVEEDLILGAGLGKASSKGGNPYDVFRNRIMFPIRDARDRCIAFGGRAMDPNDNAKYLNSPETELFDKGRNLYNQGPARVAAGKGQPLIVAEGYMDVIALVEAGYGAAVAPLGTAVTETQLQLLWRISDEPIVALDGDAAGVRAAYRVIDLALPLIESGKSLRFALMPEGKDPDDLIRAEGAGGVQKVLEAALPMVKLLWQRETEGRVFDSPERKAALDKVLRERIRQIQDPSLRSHYGEDIKQLRWALFRQRPVKRASGGWGKTDWKAPQPPSASAKASLLVSAGEQAQEQLREAVILAALLSAPDLVEEFEQQLEAMPCSDSVHRDLRDCLLRSLGQGPTEVRGLAESAIGGQALETLFAARHVAITPCVRNPGNTELARMTVAEELAKLEAHRRQAVGIAEGVEDLEGDLADESVTWRLGQAAEARSSAQRAQQEEAADFVTASNGVQLDAEQLQRSRALFESIDVTRGGKPRKSH
ncbi:DNA primase [Puniceibacterium sediminis]|uniref:DNA primase n=1 Tax=Puniceibacterium sediminis TaxID=1608407 RepID=A0A238V1F1_9RHOB|nr:DNA primase [Puniceibacterium sediminis]SNR28048.1 DNA primase [Puniceibacterium sediminis]